MNAAELYGKPPALSDDQARRTIEFCCPVTVHADHQWHDMEAVADLNLDDVTVALQWLEERGNGTVDFEVLRDRRHPNLIRFVPRVSGYASQLHVI